MEPEIPLNIESSTIKAKPRKLNPPWTYEEIEECFWVFPWEAPEIPEYRSLDDDWES
jgi:hypothetical protein